MMEFVVQSCLKRQKLLLTGPAVASRSGVRTSGTVRPPRPALSLQSRDFSDRMMGYSPMSPSSPAADQSSKMPTAQEVTTAGGVWAPTSAKRDKLAELKLALEPGQEVLDDAATPEQKLDLFLADGLHVIVKAVEQEAVASPIVEEIETWMDAETKDLPSDLEKVRWEAYLKAVSRKAGALASDSDKSLRFVRDFYEADDTTDLQEASTNVEEAFQTCVSLHRLGLLKAVADHLVESWDDLTKVSDADIDRAAVKGIELDPQASTLPLSKLNKVLDAFVGGTCADRVTAMWNLMDRDDDGLLDHSEMDQVSGMAVSPVEQALKALFQEALEVFPVRAPLSDLSLDVQADVSLSNMGWRQRRLEKRTRKRLVKVFDKTLQTHFIDEVEMPHRLRCIYAWADKAHQDNKIDSIHVEASEWSGRRRYVELEPKISLSEFRDVQTEHFPHLDRVGQEILASFRENLLVDQGKGRQSRELRRDCLLFLTVVSVIDYVIISL